MALRRIKKDVAILAKAEFFNPGGSIKDRPILSIIEKAERERIIAGKTILDATSGNAGISYALIGRAKGYPVELCVPLNASIGRRRILAALGAKLIFTDPRDGSDGAIRKARELYEKNPRRYFYGNQYDSEANWRAHYLTTGKEIIDQTEGKVTHFVAAVGTSGTLMGVGRRLREFNPKVKLVEVQPSSQFHGIEGLKHMKSSIKPAIYDPSFVEEKLVVETEEAQEMVIRLAREEGLLVGTSAGANLVAALRVSENLREGLVVTVFPDGADRYLAENYWQEFVTTSRNE